MNTSLRHIPSSTIKRPPDPAPIHRPGPSSIETPNLTTLRDPVQRKPQAHVEIERHSTGHQFDAWRNLIRRDNVPLVQIWETCRRSLYDHESRQSSGWPTTQQDDDCSSILFETLYIICQRSHCEGEPEILPSAVIKLYLQRSVMGHWWGTCLWVLLARVVGLRYGSAESRSPQQIQEEMKWLLKEVIEVWRLYLKTCSGTFTARSGLDHDKRERGEDGSEHDRARLPLKQSALTLDSYVGWPDFVCAKNQPTGQAKTMSKRFFQCIPDGFRLDAYSPLRGHADEEPLGYTADSESPQDIAAAAALSLDCIRHARSISSLEAALRDDAAPFTGFLESAVGLLPTGYRTASAALARHKIPPGVISKALANWLPQVGTLSTSAEERNALTFKRSNGASRANVKADWLSTLMIDMDRAVKSSNAELATQAWTKAQHGLDTRKHDQDPAKVDNLYTHFLVGFFRLRRAEMAITVWNYMVQKAHQITKVHWNAMLHGCIRAHDASSLRNIWASMRNSNVMPDTAAWTTYICGLIKCRQWRDGINALDQLGKVWNAELDIKASPGSRSASSELQSQSDRPVPSLAPVNAALDALVDFEKFDLLDAVLNWASSYGLRPNTHTYNILLRPLARTGDLAAIQSHLTTMSTSQCEPDIATFTIILSSLVSSPTSNFRDLIPSDQESTILSVLNAMHAASIPPNTYTYSALLSALLQPPSPNRKHHYHPSQPRSTPPVSTTTNISAAHTVLAHMAQHSIAPTPHIYTILLSHYFAQVPPDLAAIRSLWLSMQSSPGGGTAKLADPILYDRMIEGLADAGQAQDSLDFVKGMVKEGKVPGWVALGKCLEGLYHCGDVEGVRWLVEGVERDGGLLKWGERELRGRGWWARRVAELRREGVLGEIETATVVAGERGGGGSSETDGAGDVD